MNQLKKITIRLNDEVYTVLDDAAHSAKLPLAVYVREMLISKIPPVAPPVVDALSDSAKRLIKILHGLTNNLSQMDQRMATMGPPLRSLSGESGPLNTLRTIAFEIGLKAKSGALNSDKADHILNATRIEQAAAAFNELTLSVNTGMTPIGSHAHGVLTSIKASIEAAQELSK